MRVLMVGRRPSVALEDLRRYWGDVDVSTNPLVPTLKQYDLVVAQEPTLRIGIPALLQAKLSRAVFVCEVHGNYLEKGFLPRKDMVAAKAVLAFSDYARAVNSQIAASLSSWRVKNIMVIPSVYVKTDLFKPTTNHADRKNVIVSASRLVPEKGLELLIHSTPLIHRQFPDLEVRIVGDGPDRARLEYLVRQFSLQKVVKFTGWVSQEELVRHYNESAVFVCTSFYEGGPRTVFEAAACNTPFVSTAVGLVPEVFQHGVHGLIMHQRSSKLLAQNITRLLENPCLRVEMGVRARQIVEKEFEWHEAVRRYATAYLKIFQ